MYNYDESGAAPNFLYDPSRLSSSNAVSVSDTSTLNDPLLDLSFNGYSEQSVGDILVYDSIDVTDVHITSINAAYFSSP